MRRALCLGLVFSTISIARAEPANCVGMEKITQGSQIKRVPISVDKRKWKKELSKLSDEERDLVEPDLIELIGFSKDSKIAYRYEVRRGNECGSCGSIRIQDLKSDKVLQELQYEMDSDDLWSGFDADRSSTGKKKPFTATAIFKSLKQHQIFVNCELQIEQDQVTTNGEPVRAEIRKNKLILTKGAKSKSIAGLETGSGGLVAPKTVAMVVSPFEPRAIVVVGYPTVGWEDSYLSKLAFNVYGADLIHGFK